MYYFFKGIHYMYLYVIIILFLIGVFYCYFTLGVKKKHKSKFHKKEKKKKQKNKKRIKNINNYKLNIIEKLYLKLCNLSDSEEEYYLTWRYAGYDAKDNPSYRLILLSHKNNQNKFSIHFNDPCYLEKIYKKYGIYNNSINDELKSKIFATSKYNTNDEQYLEIEKFGENSDTYIIKANLWFNERPYSYLHIDDKKILYFTQGIDNDNIAKFQIV